MIRRSATLVLAFSTALLGACQTGSMPQMFAGGPERTALDGQWRSSDGIFVASFQGGQFTSTDARTNAVLAQGSYTVSGNTANLSWISAQRQQQFSAVCTLTSPNAVHCEQAGTTGFDLRRTA